MKEVEYLSDEAAYAVEGTVENACGLSEFVCETWAVTDGSGGTCRDSWLESRVVIPLDKVLSSPAKQIDGDYYLVCVRDGVAYVRHGDRGKERLQHISEKESISYSVYATYGAELFRVIKA